MEINSLMVGDYVYRMDFNSPVPTKIIGMEVVNYDKMEYVVDVLNKNGYNVQLYLNEIEPIPLSSEILEKNGFKCDAHPNYICDSYFIDGISLLDFRGGYFKYCAITLKYVHQLQHLLKLRNIDKEIEL